MSALGLVSRVRDLAVRAALGSLDSSELAAHAADLEELKARVARLNALGAAVELSPEVQALLARLSSSAVTA